MLCARVSLLLSLVLAAPLVLAQEHTAPSAVVSGHVFCSDTRTPCRFSNVTLESAPPLHPSVGTAAAPSHSYSGGTDLEGLFQIRGVAPGEYFVLARLPGYLSPYDLARSEFEDQPALLAKAMEAALVRLHVGPNGGSTDLTLTRGAAIEGTVRYDDGGLGIGLPIHLFRKNAAGEWKLYLNSATSDALAFLGMVNHTDDRGRFYQPGLPAGVYTVQTTLPANMLLPSNISGKATLNVVNMESDALPVFFGDKFSLRQASPVTLKQGDSRDLDITVPTRGLFSLAGNVTAKLGGRPVPQGTVTLDDPQDDSLRRVANLTPEGAFSMRNIPPGSYVLKIDPRPKHEEAASPLCEPLSVPLLVKSDEMDLAFVLLPQKP